MGFPDRDKGDQDTRAEADAAGSETGDRLRIKPPAARIVRPPRQTPPTPPPAPEGKKTPFTRAGGAVEGPVKVGDEPERPTVDPELGLNWLGAEGGSNKPIGKSWATSPPKVVKPPRRTGPKAQPDLVGFQQLQGTHPGDRYVRVVRQQSDDFQRVGPGHLVATEDTLEARGGVGRLFGKVKRRVIGAPLSTAMAAHERLTKVKALAVLSSDALSSVAYATEEMLRILLLAGLSALTLSLPITGAIIILIAVVGF